MVPCTEVPSAHDHPEAGDTAAAHGVGARNQDIGPDAGCASAHDTDDDL